MYDINYKSLEEAYNMNNINQIKKITGPRQQCVSSYKLVDYRSTKLEVRSSAKTTNNEKISGLEVWDY